MKSLGLFMLFAHFDFYSTSSLLGDNFGPYYLCVDELIPCKGRMKTNLTSVHAYLYDMKQSVYVNVTFHKDAVNTTGEVRIWLWDGENYKVLTKFHAHGGCRDSAIKHYLYDQIVKFTMVNGNCIIPKGLYENPKINLTELTHGIVPKFFYGKIKIRLNAFTKKSNVACMEMICESRRNKCE